MPNDAAKVDLKWTQKKPTKPGDYLRNNPCTSRVAFRPVFDINGRLQTNSGDMCLVNLETISDTFWWYGPIPKPPGAANDHPEA